MLKAEIALSDLAHTPTSCPDAAIVFGASRIEPYRHALLETLLVVTDGQWFVVVRERLKQKSAPRGSGSQRVDFHRFAELHRECLMWPLDYVMIEVAQAGCRLKLRAGALGCAPVYCRTTSDRLSVSWDFADFLARPLMPDLELAARYLGLGSTYSAQHLCAGITVLTERATLYVEPGQARYQYPNPAESRLVSPGGASGTLEEFEEILCRTIDARPLSGDMIAIELSGGLDSATVAAAATQLYGPVASKGILVDGDQRQAQRDRRDKIGRLLGLEDETVDIDAYPPSLDLRSRARAEYPNAELYLEAFDFLWSRAHAQGRKTLFTGVGGDELYPRYRDEGGDARSPSSLVANARHRAEAILTPPALEAARTVRGMDAPTSPVPVSALVASLCQAPHLLRHGLWPVNPLSHPRLVEFCHGLPPDKRHGREMSRQYLHGRLGGEVFRKDYIKETFAGVLPRLISQQHQSLVAQLSECALADLGLVDRRAALALLDEVATTRADAPAAPLIAFLWLERFVRQLS
ncbi:asparagine synthase-related protein [Frateuria sp. GZRR35]|uniref:asparagine synthase-related protein n=1 Tax=Frateuria sp. GZRR35 TaxID=3351536 RepID=UPI003EDC193B